MLGVMLQPHVGGLRPGGSHSTGASRKATGAAAGTGTTRTSWGECQPAKWSDGHISSTCGHKFCADPPQWLIRELIRLEVSRCFKVLLDGLR